MSLSVKMSGENVADLSVATGKNDTEMSSHAADSIGLNSAASSISSLRMNPSSHTDLPSIAAEGYGLPGAIPGCTVGENVYSNHGCGSNLNSCIQR